MKNTDKGNTVEMMVYRVLVSNENPVSVLANCGECISKDFENLEAAYDFATRMIAEGFAVAMCAWDKDKHRS